MLKHVPHPDRILRSPFARLEGESCFLASLRRQASKEEEVRDVRPTILLITLSDASNVIVLIDKNLQLQDIIPCRLPELLYWRQFNEP